LKDIIEILERWTNEGTPVALGSVIERVGSAPRDPGATLAVSAAGDVIGGVTGGCVEPAVIKEANEVLNGARGRIRRYGLSDADGFDVGLTCGGTIAVAVYALDPTLVVPIADAVRADRPVAVTLRLDEPRFGEQSIVPGNGTHLEGSGGDDDSVGIAARALLEIGESGIVETADGDLVFVESYASRANMYIFGASDHVAAVVPLAKSLGYRVTVCDPRRVFLTEERFPDVDELVDEWPDQFLQHAPIDSRTVICMMTHDLKFDVPALKVALSSSAGFIGAIGSEKTRNDRDARLRAAGIGDADLARLHAPVGIQIGARTPEEVAITIAAQLIEANVIARHKRIASVAHATVLS
jgi:xanthine dehydrogenase accessory factor